MLKKITYLAAALFLLWLSSCMPYREEKLTEVTPDTRDSICRQIFEWQDEQKSEKLYPYFNHKNPTYRYLAAMAFGSIKDSSSVDTLAFLLRDEIDEVRAAAAFSLGQIRTLKALPYLVDAFAKQDTAGQYSKSNRAILEAVGKCGDEQFLQFLSTITTYQPRDTFLLEGQAWGIYRYALRKMLSPEGSQRMLELVNNPKMPVRVRVIAANYFYRAKGVNLDSLQAQQLSAIFKTEKEPRVRMALAVGIGKSKTPSAFNALVAVLSQEEDYRVKCNIIRALEFFPYEKSTPLIQPLLKNEHPQVSVQAAQYFLENGLYLDASAYWNWAKEQTSWEVRLILYRAANRWLPVYFIDQRNNINAELREQYMRSENPYEKAACLKALAEFGWNYRYVFREAVHNKNAVVRTAGVTSLAYISGSDDFRKIFTTSSNYITREMAALFKTAIESGDEGMSAIAAAALQNPDRNFKAVFGDSILFLNKAMETLEIPRGLDAYNELKRTLDYFKGKKESPAVTPEFSHPVDWSALAGLESRPKVNIKTAKGIIKLELFSTIAPGSVINFIDLARAGFYDNVAFHRVISNFVIQAGSPRGDGWGGANYTIRSELSPLHYDQQGFLGMASSGNHTESTQFFITQSPTPHLDGNYTMFGRVIEGMEVVDQIQLGDLIEAVEIL